MRNISERRRSDIMAEDTSFDIEYKSKGLDEIAKVVSSLNDISEELQNLHKNYKKVNNVQEEHAQKISNVEKVLNKTSDIYKSTTNKVNKYIKNLVKESKYETLMALNLGDYYKENSKILKGDYVNALKDVVEESSNVTSVTQGLRVMTKARKVTLASLADEERKYREIISSSAEKLASYRKEEAWLRTEMKKVERNIGTNNEQYKKLYDSMSDVLIAERKLISAKRSAAQSLSIVSKNQKRVRKEYRILRKNVKLELKSIENLTTFGYEIMAKRIGDVIQKKKDAVKSMLSWNGVTKAAKSLTLKASIATEKMVIATVKLGKVLKETSIRAFTKGMSLVGQKLLKINEGFGRLAGDGVRALSQAFSDMIRGGLQKGLGMLKGFSAQAFTTFEAFQQSMEKVQIFGGFEDTIATQKVFRNALKTTLFSAEELQLAFEELAAVGSFVGKQGQIEFDAFADVMTKMSTATGEVDLERVGQILMTTVNAFRTSTGGIEDQIQSLITSGMSYEEAFQTVITGVGDTLTKVANESALSVSQIGTAMQYVNQTSASLGVSLEDTASMVGFLSNMGFEASRAGTALNQAMKSIIDPSQQARNLMTDLGVSFYDQEGNVKPMIDIIGNLNSTLGELSQQQKLEAISTIFGVRGGRAILAMMNETEKLSEMMDTIGTESAGSMEAGMDSLTNTIEGRVAQIKGTFEDLQLVFMDALSPILLDNGDNKGLLTTIRDFVQSEGVRTFFEYLGQTVSTFIKSLLPLINNLLPKLNSTLFPMLITMLSYVFELVNKLLTPLMEQSRLWELFQQIIGLVMETIDALLPTILQLGNMFVNDIMPVVMKLISIFMSLLIPVIKLFANAIMQLIPVVMPVIGKILKLFQKLSPAIMLLVKSTLNLVVVFLKAFMPVLDKLAGFLLDNYGTIGLVAGALGGFMNIVSALLPILGFLANILVSILAPALTFVLKILTGFIDAVIGGFKFVIEGIMEAAKALGMDNISEDLRGVVEALGDVQESTKGATDEMENLDGTSVNFDYPEMDKALQQEIDKRNDEVEVQVAPSYGQYQSLEGLIGTDQTYEVEVQPVPGDYKLDGVNLNVDQLNDVLTASLEPLGSSIMDIIDQSVLRDALGIGASNVSQIPNTPSGNETASQVVYNNSKDGNRNYVENVYIISSEEKIQEVVNTENPDDLVTKISEAL